MLGFGIIMCGVWIYLQKEGECGNSYVYTRSLVTKILFHQYTQSWAICVKDVLVSVLLLKYIFDFFLSFRLNDLHASSHTLLVH